jgi:hypothetical protein
MPDIHIQDIPEDVLLSLRNLATSAGVPENIWLRDYVITSLRALSPTPIQSYIIRCKGKQGSCGTIGRQHRKPFIYHSMGRFVHPRQGEAFDKATKLIERNGIGDRELAIKILQTAFEEVTEEL